MSTLLSETLLSLSQAARRLPPGRNGRPTHISTVLRWILVGVKAPGGQRVRLEATRVGNRWLTSVEALQRFATNQTPSLEDGPQPPRTPSARSRSCEKAEERLRALGI